LVKFSKSISEGGGGTNTERKIARDAETSENKRDKKDNG
jgi:hypothetical protein